MKEPVEHIERPQLPWRRDEPTLTECGLPAVKVSTLTRSDFRRRLKELGKQRTAMLTCMTCSNTARRWTDWDEDPRQALEREIQWEGSGRWAHNGRGMRYRS